MHDGSKNQINEIKNVLAPILSIIKTYFHYKNSFMIRHYDIELNCVLLFKK